MTLFKEPVRELGTLPTHIEKQDLLDFFLYAFELTWEEQKKGDEKKMKAYYDEEAKKFQPNYENLEHGQLWWLFVLLGLRELTIKEEIHYAQSTIEHLLKKAHRLSENTLFRYANEIHLPLFRDFPNAIILRYVEAERLDSISVEQDPYTKFFLSKRKDIVRIFKKHLKQKDLKEDYVEEYISSDLKRLRKFSTFWDAYFDIFVYYFATLYEFKTFEHEDDRVEYEIMDELLIALLMNSLQEEEGALVDALSEDLLDILYEFIDYRRKELTKK